MKDTFWTTELVNEYAGTFLLQAMKAIEAARNGGNVERIISASEFIASKSPKREWEVVAFKYSPNGDIITNKNVIEWGFAMGGDGLYSIHSVRRLSDGETLNVLDWFSTPACDKRQIKSFSIVNDELVIYFDNCNVKVRPGGSVLKMMQKLPSEVFTTADGKEVCNSNMELWIVGHGDSISLSLATYISRDANWNKIFSTRQAAESYILNNRLLLSLKDVKEVISSRSLREEIIDELTALVKSKLNQ